MCADHDLTEAACLEDRKLGVERLGRTSQALDRAILTLASGALILSITFLDLLSGPRPVGILLLVIAWLYFVTSILTTALSHWTSQKATHAYLVRMDMADDIRGEAAEEANVEVVRWDSYTVWLNGTSLVCFSLGIVFLTAFAIMNLLYRF